ncbi:TOX high mobility group box family member 2 [Rhincodon typus]|uniref:TOX high mobility group box family member 2 n=1 Tax=Rhincodon typus TaxID=259920 RepID=UPI00202EE5BA|nr:TOX high mobility group box family member 2 [Rhincodon typus]
MIAIGYTTAFVSDRISREVYSSAVMCLLCNLESGPCNSFLRFPSVPARAGATSKSRSLCSQFGVLHRGRQSALGTLRVRSHLPASFPFTAVDSDQFDGDNMYMSLTDANQDYLPANQSFAGQGLGDEDYEIPPITPPNLGDPSFLHLMDPHASYHSLCHSVPPNGLLPQYPYQGMDLPAIMVSNMLGQDGHPLSNQLPMMHGMGHPEGPQYDSGPQHPLVSRSGIMPPSHMSAISHSQLNAQVSLNVARSILTHGSPSPPGSKSATPSPSSSAHEEESDHLSKVQLNLCFYLPHSFVP